MSHRPGHTDYGSPPGLTTFQADPAREGDSSFDPFGFPSGFGDALVATGDAMEFTEGKGGLSRIDESPIDGTVPGSPADTAGNIIRGYASGSESEITSIQQLLADAGYPVKPSGVWDNETNEALQDALRTAMQAGMHLEEWLTKQKEQGGASDEDEKEYERMLRRAYFDIWGAPPPPGYIARAVASGMNVYEFEYYERSKPGYINSPQARQARVSFDIDLARKFGRAI